MIDRLKNGPILRRLPYQSGADAAAGNPRGWRISALKNWI